MRHAFRFFVLSVLGLMTAGCASIVLIEPDKPAVIGNGVSVMPQVRWNQLSLSGQLMWTQNGPNLDTLVFTTGIKSGDPLHPPAGLPRDALGKYDPKMLPNDVEDLVVSTMQKQGFANVHAANLAPCPFGPSTGFCFDLDFANAEGLTMKGKVIADKRADRLDLIEFRAPSEYYFDALSPAVSALFGSIQVK